MGDRVCYGGMVHLFQRVMIGFDWKQGNSTAETFLGLPCSGMFILEKSASLSTDAIDCMTCLVVEARESESL